MGCFCFKKVQNKPGYKDILVLASETPFTVNEVKALYDLFKRLSSSIIEDGLIHKEEFQLGVFRNSSNQNLFADRLFDLFDAKHNGVIEFGDFVRSLSVFHPGAPASDKTACSDSYRRGLFLLVLFRLYDLRQSGYIRREELKEMLLALLGESDLTLSNDMVELILEETMMKVDSKEDGKIDEEEWREFVKNNPSVLKNMTLPYLK
ncbi:hypothetical protein V6N13_077130 [Hibiscus sabdariffa]|uniref:Calcineurin B-like protein n=1 Tax=Hibiscus sabdariffa TaxID=183260 RepID=A0ABR2CMZ1_9ROSI